MPGRDRPWSNKNQLANQANSTIVARTMPLNLLVKPKNLETVYRAASTETALYACQAAIVTLNQAKNSFAIITNNNQTITDIMVKAKIASLKGRHFSDTFA
jgi:hypothetical protein